MNCGARPPVTSAERLAEYTSHLLEAELSALLPALLMNALAAVRVTPAPPAMVPPAARVMLPLLPAVPWAVSTTRPAPEIGALTLIARYAVSVSVLLGLVQLMAALTLISPTPLAFCTPAPEALPAEVDSVTLVPLLSEFEIEVAAVESMVRSYGATSQVPALPWATLS